MTTMELLRAYDEAAAHVEALRRELDAALGVLGNCEWALVNAVVARPGRSVWARGKVYQVISKDGRQTILVWPCEAAPDPEAGDE